MIRVHNLEKSLDFYDLITYNVRITRDLNNIHLEQDEKKVTPASYPTMQQQKRIGECLDLFNSILKYLPELNPDIKISIPNNKGNMLTPFILNDAQMISLEKLIIELNSMRDDMNKLPHLSLA